MTTTINASTSTGLSMTADGSGIMKLQSNGVTTNALAWVSFNGVTTAVIRASYNVSSITRNGTGDYTVNFTNTLADANYAAACCGNSGSGTTRGVLMHGPYGATPTTSAFRAVCVDSTTAAYYEPAYAYVVIHGN